MGMDNAVIVVLIFSHVVKEKHVIMTLTKINPDIILTPVMKDTYTYIAKIVKRGFEDPGYSEGYM